MSEQQPGRTDLLDRARTPLLALITRESLDQDYEMVARRRPDRGEPDGRTRTARRAAVIGVVAVFGLMATVAGVQTSRNAADADESRESLIERIEARRAAVREAQTELADLRAEAEQAEDALLAANDELNVVQGQRLALEGQTGFAPVTGEGVRVELDNADNAGDHGLIVDSDLTLLVNALWQVGAEAISVDGQRLTALSAIRSIDQQLIEVNSIGIAPPYTILAIGDSNALSAELLDTASGLAFLSLANQFGFQYDIDKLDEVRIPDAPASQRRLRSAEQGSAGDPELRRPEGDGTS